MRFAAVLVPLTLFAAPAEAQRSAPALPPAPRGVDYAETVCSGGIDGRYEVVRVLAGGEVVKVTRRAALTRSRAPAGEAASIQRALDRARFDRRIVQRVPHRIADGIDCTLTRRKGGVVHSVVLQQEVAGDAGVQDLVAIVSRIAALGRAATGPILRPAAER